MPPTTGSVSEVVVTAERRPESLQAAPLSVSAFDAASLKARRIDAAPDLQLNIPNVSFSRGEFGAYDFQIRGVGSKLIAVGAEAATAVHVNEAALTDSTLADAQFFDVDRVEVLRGPQGTLFGRNATGGVVNIVTAKPTALLSGAVTGEIGDYGAGKLTGFLNMPLAEGLALRVAGVRFVRDGVTQNDGTGRSVDGRDLYGTRVSLAWSPSTRVRATGLWEHFDEDDDRLRVSKMLCVKDLGPSQVGGVPTDATTRNLLSQGCLPGSLYGRSALSTLNAGATLPGILRNLAGLTSGDTSATSVVSPHLREIDAVTDPAYRAGSDLYQLLLDVDLTPGLTLHSLTSYDRYVQRTQEDGTFSQPSGGFRTTPLTPGGVFVDPQLGPGSGPLSQDRNDFVSKQVSQEVRLSSDFKGWFDFSFGGQYLRFRTLADYYLLDNGFTSFSELTNLLTSGCPALGGAANPGCIYVDPDTTPNSLGHNYFYTQTLYTLESKAVFGEIYLKPRSDLKITAGLRYTDDRKSERVSKPGLLTPGAGAGSGSLRASFDALTGRLAADWTTRLPFADRSLIYASYARGYKSGGFNTPASVGTAGTPPTYAPESLDAFELGAKNTLLGGRLQLNLAGFFNRYQGYQIAQIIQRVAVNQNVDAQIYGAEAEAVWRPVEALTLNASLGLMHSEITGGESLDVLDRTQGAAGQTLVKAQDGSNCVANTDGVARLLGAIDAGAVPATALLGVCPTGQGAAALSPTALDSLFAITPSQGEPVALAGKSLPNAPAVTLAFGAEYAWRLGGDWRLSPRADLYAQTNSYARIYNALSDRLYAYAIVNLSLRLSAPSRGLDLQFYVKNLADKTVITSSFVGDDSFGLSRSIFLSDPRTYGVSLTKAF